MPEQKQLIEGEVEGELYRHCRRCHRDLKNPKYQKIGYGPVCLKKITAGGL